MNIALLTHTVGRHARCLLPLLALGILPGRAAAQSGWIQWTGGTGANGHWFLAVHVPGGIDWNDARQRAIELGGDLATITSAAENTFVFQRIADPVFWRVVPNPTRIFGPWLGGYQPAGSAEPLGGWTWVTGESWSWQNWAPNEPNNYNGMQEDHLHFFTGGTTPLARWNDLRSSSLVPGFVVESTSPPSAAYVSLGAGCAPGGLQPPTLLPASGLDAPRIGTTSWLRFANLPANTQLAIVAVGLSNRYAAGGALPLPIDLAPLGWSGCKQLVAADLLVGYAPTAPFVDHPVTLPANAALVGSAVFFQGLCLTPNEAALSASVGGYVGP